jgi:peptidoglycan/LPS O-acetylase OafA/YrhL
VLYHLLALALYLGGVPADNNKIATLKKSYGWFFLSYLKPQAVFDYKWFYLFWASTLLVFCTSKISGLRSFFENRFNQYLGRISFALYLVHGPILNILGDRLYAAVGWVNESNQEGLSGWVNLMPLPKTGPKGLELSLILPQIVLLPLTLWIADAVTRLVDTPSVNFAKWLHGKTLAPSNLLKM